MANEFQNKYLDSEGLSYLWSKIKAADKSLFNDSALEIKYDQKVVDGEKTPWIWLEATNASGKPEENHFISTGFDASDFLVDGMLSDVMSGTGEDLKNTYSEHLSPEQIAELEKAPKENFLLFLWNTNDEKGKKVVIIKASVLAPVYKAGQGINIENGAISANVATGTPAVGSLTDGNVNYLTNGEAGLAVKKMGAEATKLTKDITIMGGPLAETVSNTFGGKIDANTSIEDILFKLLCEEKFVSPEQIHTFKATLNSQVDVPNIVMSTSDVEVGASVAYTVTNGASSSEANPHTASGFAYGYSSEDNDTKEHTEASVSAKFGAISLKSDTSELTISGAATGTAPGTSKAGSAKLTGTIVSKSTPKTYTLSAKNTSATYTGTCEELPVYYACSNLGNTDSTRKSVRKDAATITSISTNCSAEKSFTTYYKCFYGMMKNEAEINSTSIRKLTGKLTTTTSVDLVGGTAIEIQPGDKYVIACPPDYSLKHAENGLGLVTGKDEFEANKQTNVTVLDAGQNELKYTIYYKQNQGSTAAGYKNIKIGK